MQVFQIKFQELTLHRELRQFILPLSERQFLKDEVEHARHNTDVLLCQADSAARAHGVGLAGAGLPVRENGRVVAVEAPEDLVFGAEAVEVYLVGFGPEDVVEGELLAVDLEFTGVVFCSDACAAVRSVAQLATNQWPDTYGDFDRTVLYNQG